MMITCSRQINIEDRIYAKLVLNGETIVEFVRDRINGLSGLVKLLRSLSYSYRGLAKMTIRNISRGWRVERPLLLSDAMYAANNGEGLPVKAAAEGGCVPHSEGGYARCAYSGYARRVKEQALHRDTRVPSTYPSAIRPLMPWQTH